jgi:hypothetical protein
MPGMTPTVDTYSKGTSPVLMGICPHTNSLTRELELGAIKPEPLVLCCVHKPDETWDGKRGLFEKHNTQPLEARCDDLTNKYLEVGKPALEA